MRSAQTGTDYGQVSSESIHLAIDVLVDGEEIRGHAGDGLGPPTQFSGWLGLMGVLDVLLAAAPSRGVARSGVRLCLGFATSDEAEAFAASEAVCGALQRYGATGPPGVWALQHGGSQGAALTVYQNRRADT